MDLANYIDYLASWRKLQESTIKGYLSAIKVLHYLNGVSKFTCKGIFSNYIIKRCLEGVANCNKIDGKPSNPRRVMSFECLQLLGHALLQQGLNDFDTLVVWAACLLGYWGSFRMGEIIPSGNLPHQQCTALKWGRVLQPEANKLTISVKFPKTVKHTNAQAVEVYEFMDKNYCPVQQLIDLYHTVQTMHTVSQDDFVFRLKSGAMLTMPYLNIIIRNSMSMFFDNTHRFSCHSFRAGIPAWMASKPHLFNEQEIMVCGRWTSQAFQAYTRQAGIARDISIQKVQKSLKKQVHYSISFFKYD